MVEKSRLGLPKLSERAHHVEEAVHAPGPHSDTKLPINAESVFNTSNNALANAIR